MREYMEPLGVCTTISIHLADEGQASCQAHPTQSRAVITLATTTTTVQLFVSTQNLDRLSRVISDAQAALNAGPIQLTEPAESTEPGEPQPLVGKVA